MTPDMPSRDHARAIWQAAVAAVNPTDLIRAALARPDLRAALDGARRILVVGGGKAGASMAAAVEDGLADRLDRLTGVVNVPAETVRPLRAIHLHAARPAAVNHPTAEGVAGSNAILALLAEAGPDDVALCLLSGGGSALLPAPAEGITLADKQQVTHLLHACGATIDEMNCVRKHLSRIKGGRLAQAFLFPSPPTPLPSGERGERGPTPLPSGERGGRNLFSLILSDVIGDPLDVIASGPTAPDPTTFADARAVLQRFDLLGRVPAPVLDHLDRGGRGLIPETPKTLPDSVHNVVVGNNALALAAATRQAEALGYRVLNLGSFLEGETSQVALVLAALVRGTRADQLPLPPPVCILSGGETTVTLAADHGKGGRNQELVLAIAARLGAAGLDRVVVLSGGTDGEDGPTDAAGAVADPAILTRAAALGLDPGAFLRRHDAYPFFQATGGLLLTGLTQTNVMDVRVLLIGA